MKKIKMISVFFMLFVIMMITSGCSTQTEVNVDESGKGAVSIKLEIPKDGIESTGYCKVDSPEELVKILESKTAEGLNLEFSVDKKSSSDKDYIVASLTFDSIEEFNKQISDVLIAYNMMTAASDVEDMFGYMPGVSNSIVYESAAIEKYFVENGFKVDKEDRNVRKFAKLVKSLLVFDEETIEGDEKLKYVYGVGYTKANIKSNETVQIIDKDGDKVLKIQKIGIDCLRMYMQRFLIKYQTEIFNLGNIQSSTDAVGGLETKEILCWTFEGICLADKVKAVLDEKDAKEYNLSELTPFMAVSLFDDEYVEEFKMAWNREYKNYQEEKSYEGMSEDFENVESAVFKERNTSVTFIFGDNKVELTDDEYLDAYADNQYVTICSKENGVYEPTGAIDYKNSYDSDADKKDNDNISNDSCNDEEEIDTTGKESEESEEETVLNDKEDNKEDVDKISKADNDENESKNESTPKTGDFNFLNEIAIIGAVALAIVIVILRKRAMN